MTPVIFRKFKTGEVLALFPTLPGTNDPHTCQSYQHIGQHGAASADCSYTKPATPAEYADLLRELVSIGYDDLKIVKRFTRQHFTIRSY